ncbi:MAG: beta-lactamase family protein [Spirochaetales bacterium]|nr:beta-lactamase family protein [Spirochaetales bacterium]
MMHEFKADCAAAEVNYNPAAIERLDRLSEELIGKGTIQAACYLLARHGKVIAHKSAGKLTRDKGSADYLPDSIRPIASLTKAFTAVGIWQLLEQGKIYLHQQVREILKEFDTTMHEQITIYQLLTHTSGLRTYPGAFLEPYTEDWDEKMNKDNWIKRMMTGPLQFKPDTTWNYCNFGFQFLAEIITRVSGIRYDKYIEKNIIKPLQLKDTCFSVPEKEKNRVCLTSEWDKWFLDRSLKDIPTVSLLGAGGMYSSVADMFRFGQMLLNGGELDGVRILGRKTVESGTKIHVRDLISYNWHGHIFNDSHKVSYGLGLEVNKHKFLTDGTYDHEGAGGVLLFMDPVEDFLFAGIFSSEDWHGESWVSPLAVAWGGIG